MILILTANVYDLKIIMNTRHYELEVFSNAIEIAQWLRALDDLPSSISVTYLAPYSHL